MKRIAVWLLIVIAIVGGLGYCVAALKAKDLLFAQIRQHLHRESSVGSISLRFPLRLVITDLKLFEPPPRQQEAFLAVREASVAPSLASLLAGRVVLHEVVLTNPDVVIERLPDGRLNCSDLIGIGTENKGQGARDGAAAGGSTGSVGVLPAMRVVIDRGVIRWVDRAVAGDPVAAQVRDLSLRVTVAPKSLSSMKIEASVGAQAEFAGGTARLGGRGWYELPDQNLQAQLRLEGVDAVAVSPYLGLQPFQGVKRGTIDVDVDATAERNQLKAVCRLQAHGLALTDPTASDSNLFTSLLAGVVSGGEVALDLDVSGTLDQPKTWQVRLSGDFMRKAVQQALVTGLGGVLQEGGGATAGAPQGGQDKKENAPADAGSVLREQLKELLQ